MEIALIVLALAVIFAGFALAKRSRPKDLSTEIARLAGALEERRSQEELTTLAVRKIEAILTGSFSRGRAGENVLAAALDQLPPEMVARNFTIGGRVCEFALRMTDGKLLPVDSKWGATDLIEQVRSAPDSVARDQLAKRIEKMVSARLREVAGYIDGSTTLPMAVVVLPDDVYHCCRTIHGTAAKMRLTVVPTSSALPILLSIWNLHRAYSRQVDDAQLISRLHEVTVALGELGDRLEGHLYKGLTQAMNAVGVMRSLIAGASSTLDAIAPEGRELRDVDRQAEAV